MDIAGHPVVRALRPSRAPYLAQLSGHSGLQVWHIDVEFEEFAIPHDLAIRWSEKQVHVAETWQKRPLVVGHDSGNPYSCGEVELAARLRAAGYEAHWISEWVGFKHVPAWEPYCIKRNEFRARAPHLWEYDQSLRADAGYDLGTSGGHPDIACVASTGNIYLEYKGPADSIKPKQNMWAAAITEREHPRLVYLTVRGLMTRAQRSDYPLSNPVTAPGDLASTVSSAMRRANSNTNAPPSMAPSQKRRSDSPAKGEKLHRRTISDTLKRQRSWQVTSKVDGSIDFTPPPGVSIDSYAADVRSAVEAMGYKPTVRIGRGARGHSVVRVHTPETLAQAPRGAHGA